MGKEVDLEILNGLSVSTEIAICYSKFKEKFKIFKIQANSEQQSNKFLSCSTHKLEKRKTDTNYSN